MNLVKLGRAVCEMKSALEDAITSAKYRGKRFKNGVEAKQALIRSQTLILRIHEVVKTDLVDKIEATRSHSIHPPLGKSKPELKISGFIKAKDQDLVMLFDGDEARRETIADGPLKGDIDPVGRQQSERAVVVGVRSQMSSVAKNFDTLMERAFAETLNLRLRLPGLVMGEVYILPIVEYDDVAMRTNRVAWKKKPIPVEKFIRTFTGITGRAAENVTDELYKYERTALVLADFRPETPRVFLTLEELKSAGAVSADFEADFAKLSPQDFARDLLAIHRQRHPPGRKVKSQGPR